MFRTLVAALERIVPRVHGQTLQDYSQALELDERVPIDVVHNAFSSYEEVRFGRRPFDDTRAVQLREALRAARDAAKRTRLPS